MRALALLYLALSLAHCSPTHPPAALDPDWQPVDHAFHPHFGYAFPEELVAGGVRAASSHWAFLGEIDSAAAVFGREEGGHPVVELPERKRLPAAATVLERAAAVEVTLINEAHHLPYHRTFTAGLLAGLYERGYRHLALESVMPFPLFDSLANAPDPQLIVGFQAREPEFAQLVREARRVGFRIFGYDQPGQGGQPAREIAAARNIVSYRREHPEGKLLVHCGYAHAREGHYAYFAGGPLAQRLADSLGTDPLTVSQTSFPPGGVGEVSVVAPSYAPVADSNSRFDLYVVHPESANWRVASELTYTRDVPPPGDAGGRPAYKFTLGRSPLRVVVTGERFGTGSYLLFAYPPSANPGLSMPLDVVPVRGGETVTLAVPDGPLQLRLVGREAAFGATVDR